ncbi:uncharacterized protein LOC125601237 [Brassica napus]|uniref:uncharacterized protein LOC106394309 n=1 Tax=Brassica napus TaxID=3708 RepID=UPI002078BE5D|nr:uncharacterized protein LOC106394309 [Brassica napus]XP_048629474.1 uncharacterized protein LOC125601237 [Brassica napus]
MWIEHWRRIGGSNDAGSCDLAKGDKEISHSSEREKTQVKHVKEDGRGSWMWRKLLKLRSLVYEFMRFEVNDGRTAFFWFDDWLRMGRLIDITGNVGTCYLGIARNARVNDAARQSEWRVRGQRSQHYHELHARIQAEPVPDEERGGDVVLWKHSDDNYKTCFSSAKTWDQIRDRRPVVFWSKSVWFTQGVPRMRAWGIQQGCVLCGERDETRDHIFFACPYPFTVWDTLANRLTCSRTDPDWMHTVQFVSNNNLQLLDKILERNDRRHQTGYRTVQQVVRIVDKAVKNRITSLRYKSEHKLAGLMQRWFAVTG